MASTELDRPNKKGKNSRLNSLLRGVRAATNAATSPREVERLATRLSLSPLVPEGLARRVFEWGRFLERLRPLRWKGEVSEGFCGFIRVLAVDIENRMAAGCFAPLIDEPRVVEVDESEGETIRVEISRNDDPQQVIASMFGGLIIPTDGKGGLPLRISAEALPKIRSKGGLETALYLPGRVRKGEDGFEVPLYKLISDPTSSRRALVSVSRTIDATFQGDEFEEGEGGESNPWNRIEQSIVKLANEGKLAANPYQDESGEERVFVMSTDEKPLFVSGDGRVAILGVDCLRREVEKVGGDIGWELTADRVIATASLDVFRKEEGEGEELSALPPGRITFKELLPTRVVQFVQTGVLRVGLFSGGAINRRVASRMIELKGDREGERTVFLNFASGDGRPVVLPLLPDYFTERERATEFGTSASVIVRDGGDKEGGASVFPMEIGGHSAMLEVRDLGPEDVLPALEGSRLIPPELGRWASLMEKLPEEAIPGLTQRLLEKVTAFLIAQRANEISGGATTIEEAVIETYKSTAFSGDKISPFLGPYNLRLTGGEVDSKTTEALRKTGVVLMTSRAACQAAEELRGTGFNQAQIARTLNTIIISSNVEEPNLLVPLDEIDGGRND